MMFVLFSLSKKFTNREVTGFPQVVFLPEADTLSQLQYQSIKIRQTSDHKDNLAIARSNKKWWSQEIKCLTTVTKEGSPNNTV